MAKELIFSITRADFDWEYFRGTGHGGQKKNKTSNAVRCTHRKSGAVGRAEDTRSQAQNRKIAFRRCIETPTFKTWCGMEIAKKLHTIKDVEQEVEEMMNSKYIRIEGKNKEGKWMPIEQCTQEESNEE